jgi:hypothetical protein
MATYGKPPQVLALALASGGKWKVPRLGLRLGKELKNESTCGKPSEAPVIP